MNSIELIPEEHISAHFTPLQDDGQYLTQDSVGEPDSTARDKPFIENCYDFIRFDRWTEERKYHFLSTFLDGVPLPQSMQPVVLVTIDSVPPTLDTTTIKNLVTQKPLANALFLHEPYAEKRCFECHEMDTGKKFGSDIGSLCYTCHQDFSNLDGFVHGPVAVGLCQGCHNPHSSKYEFLLARTGDDLCTFCHDVMSSNSLELHQIDSEKTCLECHDPHNSINSEFLVMESDSL